MFCIVPFLLRGDNMEVEFYNTTDNANTINKTLQPIKTVNIIFRQAVNESTPFIIMSKDNLTGSNYVHIPTFNRYYFISSVDNYTANLVRINLTCDLLMTYKDDIINSPVLITATEKPSYFSSSLPTQTKTIKRVVKSDVTLNKENSLILTTIGGINK